MKFLAGILAVMTLVFLGSSQATAKHYGTCEAAFANYQNDHNPHKAFATTNGSIPGHGDMVCGGSGGNDMGRTVFFALKECAIQAKRSHFSGKCSIIRKQ
jgi:hypothetical protein